MWKEQAKTMFNTMLDEYFTIKTCDLFQACLAGNLDSIIELEKNGCDLAKHDTAFLIALSFYHFHITSYLIKKGISFPTYDLLRNYVKQQDLVIVEYLVLTLGMDIEQVMKNETKDIQLWAEKILLKKQLQHNLSQKKEIPLLKI